MDCGNGLKQEGIREGYIKDKEYKNKYFLAFLLGITCVFSIFYARYSTYSESRSTGDIQKHTLVAEALFEDNIDDDNPFFPKHAYAYPAYHFTQKIVHFVLCVDYETAAAFVLTGSIIIAVLFYRQLALMIMGKGSVRNRYLADFLAIGSVLFETARCPLNDWRYYQLQCAANPFHNPTILFVRPFAIASFLFFNQYIKTYEYGNRYKYAILFSITTLFSVAAKPSYAIVFLPAMGIYTLYYVIRNRRWRFAVEAFMAVLPSLILLILQQSWMSAHTEAVNMRIKFGFFWEQAEFGTWQELLYAVLGASIVTFPVVILLFRIYSMKKDSFYAISIIALAIGWFQMFFLTTGIAGDFSWGYDLAVQFATLISLSEIEWHSDFEKSRHFVNYAAYGIFGYQVITGIRYLWLIYTTDAFWI